MLVAAEDLDTVAILTDEERNMAGAGTVRHRLEHHNAARLRRAAQVKAEPREAGRQGAFGALIAGAAQAGIRERSTPGGFVALERGIVRKIRYLEHFHNPGIGSLPRDLSFAFERARHAHPRRLHLGHDVRPSWLVEIEVTIVRGPAAPLRGSSRCRCGSLRPLLNFA